MQQQLLLKPPERALPEIPSWPPRLLLREWDRFSRDMVLLLLSGIGDEDRAVYAWDGLVEEVRSRGIARLSGQMRRRGPSELLEELRRAESDQRRGCQSVLDRLVASCVAEYSFLTPGRLKLCIDRGRALDLARDPADDPHVGDEGRPDQNPATWQQVLEVRKDRVLVCWPQDRDQRQEWWLMQGWRRWARGIKTWVRGPVAPVEVPACVGAVAG